MQSPPYRAPPKTLHAPADNNQAVIYHNLAVANRYDLKM